MKDTFNEYLNKAQKMNSSKVINEGGFDPITNEYKSYGNDQSNLKEKIIGYLDQIFDIEDLIQIENFVESKISGDTSLTWGSSDGE